ncbi:glutamate ABC transporter substrate-binding protein [Aeromicrobium sp. CF3.5]|uniref:glutamate ABC transporter substrate-binding protein n=1 Tax=Aeromicrobium sp. CF3.5 TaxID=3373078 RepID=UPI003EE6EB1A
MKRTRLAVMAAAVALTLGACGNAGEEDTDPVENDVAADAASQFEDGTRMKEIAEAGTVKIGVKFDQPGLGFKAAGQDQPTGFDVEMAKIAAAKLGIAAEDIEWVETISDNREPFLQQGTVDFVFASYSITDERRTIVGQAGPYFLTGQQLLVTKDSDIADIDDVQGEEVCSVTGSTSLSNVEEAGAIGRGFETYSQCRDQVLDGAIDSMTTDGSILLGYAAENPDELEVVGEPFSEERIGMGFSQDSPELCQFLTDSVTEAQDDGRWADAFQATLGASGAETPDPPAMDPCA